MEKYEKLKEIFKKSISEIFNLLSEYNVKEADIRSLESFIFFQNDKFTTSHFHIEILQELSNHAQINSHFDKLLGTCDSQTRIDGPQFVRRFLIWNLYQYSHFNEEDFEVKFSQFINFFENNTIKIVRECRLFNFDSSLTEIDFGDVKIVKSIPDKKISWNDFSVEDHFLSNFSIVHTQEQKKKISSDIDDVDSASIEQELKDNEKNWRAIHECFERVIISLRILKSSGCYRDHRIKRFAEGFYSQFGISTGSSLLANTTVGSKCTIDENDVKKLLQIWNYLKNTNKKAELSSNRLSFISERRNIEDKVLDCFIGLEALYLPDGNAELSYRLSLRIAKQLETTPERQEDLYNFIKNMYNKRSKLAHGESCVVSTEELIRLETLLRESVYLYLEDQSKFTIENLNKFFT